jgi:hypothetical protein
MAEKIEMFAGWDWDSSVIVGRERNHHLPYRCTVVVHQGDIERVFTESEVKAILHDMRSWIDPDDGEEGRMWETRAKLHGIVLDPA